MVRLVPIADLELSLGDQPGVISNLLSTLVAWVVDAYYLVPAAHAIL